MQDLALPMAIPTFSVCFKQLQYFIGATTVLVSVLLKYRYFHGKHVDLCFMALVQNINIIYDGLMRPYRPFNFSLLRFAKVREEKSRTSQDEI